MVYFLLIDTSTNNITIGVGGVGKPFSIEQTFEGGEQAGQINLMIEEVLQRAGLTLPRIDCIGLCAGPGSYTGLRVGMSVAKGIAFALNKPLLCFDRLQLIALSNKDYIPSGSLCGVLLRARKGEYFWALFSSEGETIEAPVHLFEEELQSKIRRGRLVITDTEQFNLPKDKITLKPDFYLNLANWLDLANKRFKEKSFSDIAYAEPFYLKAAYTTTPKKNLL